MKVRLYKIASDVGIQNADLVKKCRMLGFNVRNHMSTIEEAEVQVVKRAIDRERQKPVKEKVLRAGVLLRKGVHKPTPPTPEEEIAAVPTSTAGIPSMPADMPAAPAVEGGWTADSEAGEPALASVQAAPATDSVQPPVTDTEPPVQGVPEAHEVVEQAHGVELPSAAGTDERSAGEGMPRIVGRIELPKPLAKVASKPTAKTTAESEAAKKLLSTRKGDPRRPARRIEEMRASAVPAWDARAKRPRKKKVAPGTKTRKTEITTPKAIKRVVRIEGQISLQELAKAMEVKATEVLMRLIKLGMTGVHINSSLDLDTAKIVAAEFSYEVEDVSFEERGLIQAATGSDETEDEDQLSSRAPVVTVMGHVDHGKTSLLDYIRESRVAKGEAGGITQSIGASELKTKKGRIVFIDTPGHEAFTEMRARGAQVTDLVVLVVAANDGVQAQTVESIDHARAAGVPIVIAVNKMDLPNANPERVRKELSDHELLSEDWGGETLFAEVSAETGQGIDQLLENLLLQAEMLDLKCNPDRPAHGSVIEARLDKGRGPVASVLVTDGTLRAGDHIVAGATFGRVRAMTNHLGKPVQVAEPSTAVEVLGLNNVPLASDPVDMVADLKKAQLVAESRADKLAAAGATGTGTTALEDILSKIQAGEKAELKVILKADVQGSLEAVNAAILKLGTDKVGTSVIRASVGGITESDVNLGSASGALIVGFNVRPAGKARSVALSEKVDVRMYTVIYDLLDDIRKSMIGMLDPVVEEVYLGRALVKQTFNITKLGMVAGCEITEGKVLRTGSVRLVRDSAVVRTGKIASLRHFKDDVKEVVAGLECGISIEGYNDIKAGDEMEFFEEQEREPTLE